MKRLPANHCFGIALASTSGRDKARAGENLAKLRKALGPLGSEFKEVAHPDGTYCVLYRVWPIAKAGRSS